MKLSLVVTTYNRHDALLLVLQSIESQSLLPGEVIIADDGSKSSTQKIINDFQKKTNLSIKHSWQKDKGFRAAKSRNKAIAKASGEYIVLIDGDTILHPEFIRDHVHNAEKGFFVQGSRALLTKQITRRVLLDGMLNFNFLSTGLKNRKNTIHSRILSKFFSNKKNHLVGIKSCNMAFYKEDCININGFNNDIEGWGREDSEFAIRLLNNNIQRKTIRFNSLQFHLWHNESERKSLEINDAILKKTIDSKLKWSTNGINNFI
tara:strand:- start:3299 stop:4084 length:786 start_codon:yes stop_codon:yes gene_type:complete